MTIKANNKPSKIAKNYPTPKVDHDRKASKNNTQADRKCASRIKNKVSSTGYAILRVTITVSVALIPYRGGAEVKKIIFGL